MAKSKNEQMCLKGLLCSEETMQFIRFCVVGIIATGLHYGLYWLLYHYINYSIAYTIYHRIHSKPNLQFCTNKLLYVPHQYLGEECNWFSCFSRGKLHVAHSFVECGSFFWYRQELGANTCVLYCNSYKLHDIKICV